MSQTYSYIFFWVKLFFYAPHLEYTLDASMLHLWATHYDVKQKLIMCDGTLSACLGTGDIGFSWSSDICEPVCVKQFIWYRPVQTYQSKNNIALFGALVYYKLTMFPTSTPHVVCTMLTISHCIAVDLALHCGIFLQYTVLYCNSVRAMRPLLSYPSTHS